jgi:hypothetical protein
MIEEHAHQIANPGLTGRRQHLHFGSLLGALHSAPFGRSKFLLQPPVRIEFQILQPLFDNRSLDRIQFLSAPARRNPPVEIALIPVACRPRTTVLAFVDKFFQTEVFDHIIHRDSTECVALIGVDGQPPTSHRSFRGCFCLVLVKCAKLSLLSDTFTVRTNMPPAKHPDRRPAAVFIQVKRAILLPRIPHKILLSLRAQNASVMTL